MGGGNNIKIGINQIASTHLFFYIYPTQPPNKVYMPKKIANVQLYKTSFMRGFGWDSIDVAVQRSILL